MKLTTFVCICAVWSEHTLESVPAGEENEGFLCLCCHGGCAGACEQVSGIL